MVLIYTGIDSLDQDLAQAIEDSKIAYYPEYLFEDTESKTVILSSRSEVHVSFVDYLFALRSADKRVILLADPDSEYISRAFSLGIYDIFFDPVDIKDIAKAVETPKTFSYALKAIQNAKGEVEIIEVEIPPIQVKEEKPAKEARPGFKKAPERKGFGFSIHPKTKQQPIKAPVKAVAPKTPAQPQAKRPAAGYSPLEEAASGLKKFSIIYLKPYVPGLYDFVLEIAREKDAAEPMPDGVVFLAADMGKSEAENLAQRMASVWAEMHSDALSIGITEYGKDSISLRTLIELARPDYKEVNI